MEVLSTKNIRENEPHFSLKILAFTMFVLNYKSLSILNVRSTILSEFLFSNMYVIGVYIHDTVK